jgi:hypothetical protein
MKYGMAGWQLVTQSYILGTGQRASYLQLGKSADEPVQLLWFRQFVTLTHCFSHCFASSTVSAFLRLSASATS